MRTLQHKATDAYIGYLHQGYYTLVVLLDAGDVEAVCVETDDGLDPSPHTNQADSRNLLRSEILSAGRRVVRQYLVAFKVDAVKTPLARRDRLHQHKEDSVHKAIQHTGDAGAVEVQLNSRQRSNNFAAC